MRRVLRNVCYIVLALMTLASAMTQLRTPRAQARDSQTLTNRVVFNIIDTRDASVLVSADYWDVLVNVTYMGSKPGKSVPDTVLPPVAVPRNTTVEIPIDMSDPAFAGGFGAVRVDSVDETGTPSTTPFVAYVRLQSDETVSMLGSKAFVGPQFVIPLRNSTYDRVRLAITSLNAEPITIDIRSHQTGYARPFEIPPFATMRWDSTDLPPVPPPPTDTVGGAHHMKDLGRPDVVRVKAEGLLALVVSGFWPDSGGFRAHTWFLPEEF